MDVDRTNIAVGGKVYEDTIEQQDSVPSPTKSEPETFWYVCEREQKDGLPDIDFQVARAGCPLAHRDLKNQIERSLSVINTLYASNADSRKRAEAFAKLLALSRVGLVGKNASPEIALDALRALEADVVSRESGFVKNGYMKKLGAWAAAFSFLSLLIFFLCDLFPNSFSARILGNKYFLTLWAGCMLGTWLSFATRKVVIGFNDLVLLEEDRIDPALRLIFSGFLTMILGLIFKTGMANIEIGKFSGIALMQSASVAFLIGAFAGLSEKALPSAIVSRAGDILPTNKS